MRTFKRLTLGLMCSVLACGGHADSIKLSGVWYDGITVQSFHNGQVIYRSAGGGENSQALIQLQAIKVSTIPQVEQGVTALHAHDFHAAVKALGLARGQAQQAWLKQYLDWNLAQAYNQLGQGPDAARAYLALIYSQADPFFWEDPPAQAVAGSSPRQKEKILRLLESARPYANPAAGARLDALARVAAVSRGSALAQGSPEVSKALADAIVLPKAAPGGDPVVQSLRAGRFEQARAQAKAQLDQPGSLAQKLYLHGRAVLALAQQGEDLGLYQTAGLSFARVMIYFPQSDWAGPALLELGYVHEKIGQPDKANELYQRAAAAIDPKEDPAYHQRMIRIMNALPGSAKPQPRKG